MATQAYPKDRPALDLFRLDGRIALVTGGSGRYGRDISTALAEAGAHVIIASRDLSHCEAFAEELRARQLKASAGRIDLRDETSIHDLARAIQIGFGELHILFNNAVLSRRGAFPDQTADDWRETLDANAAGLFIACRTFGEIMVKQAGGSIVNVSSIYGMVGPDLRINEGTEMVNSPSYTFAKGGIIAFTRYLATCFAPQGIRVNCISPGGLYNGQSDLFVQNYCRRTPMGRMACGNDIKGASVFLASDASEYITGQNLAIDGGWTAW
jgi:NAD(P)-dependent dehydrogenase (short-subunit alcohol dehydrogenase family)